MALVVMARRSAVSMAAMAAVVSEPSCPSLKAANCDVVMATASAVLRAAMPSGVKA